MNGTAINFDRLVPSPPSLVLGAYEVEARYLDLCGLHFRLHGTELDIPTELDAAIMRWREMRVRHGCPAPPRGCGHKAVLLIDGRIYCSGCGGRKGDYRHTDSEVKALKEIAYWTLRVNAELRNQKVPQVEL